MKFEVRVIKLQSCCKVQIQTLNLPLQVRPVVFGRDGVLPAQRVPPVRRRPLRGPRLRMGHRRRGVRKVRLLVPILYTNVLIQQYY